MRYTGIQPQYFPRLHYFARILATDVFAIRDDVQFVRKHKYPDGNTGKSYQAHTPIKQAFGMQLLMVPTKHDGFIPINKTEIAYDHDWVENHLRTIRTAYAKAQYFSTIYPEVEILLHSHYPNLAALNIATILWGIAKLLGVSKVGKKDLIISSILSLLKKQKKFRLKDIKLASESKALKKQKNLSANEKIVALCKEYDANVDYCGGTGVAAYVDHSLFEENGISIEVQDWKCKTYPQLFTKQQGFFPNLSILDLLLSISPKEASSIIAG